MLPFTKRPGRGDEADEVLTKDDIAKPEPSAPAPSERKRSPLASLSDDELTHLMPSKSIGNAVSAALGSSRPAPLPAAGRPATASPSSRPASVPPVRTA